MREVKWENTFILEFSVNLTWTDQSQSTDHLGPGGRTGSGPGPWWILVKDRTNKDRRIWCSLCVCLCVLGVGGLGWRGIAPWLLLIAAHYILGGSNHSGFLCVCVVCVVWVCGCVQVSTASVDSLLVLQPQFIISREISEPPLQPAHLPIKDPLKSI